MKEMSRGCFVRRGRPRHAPPATANAALLELPIWLRLGVTYENVTLGNVTMSHRTRGPPNALRLSHSTMIVDCCAAPSPTVVQPQTSGLELPASSAYLVQVIANYQRHRWLPRRQEQHFMGAVAHEMAGRPA
ncbi:hypothetical protein EVAR_100102_1 [Eumeta japonica]|uniref:Uncharacterized protein n=1 Tax=Eumeta variegata TaxID=151549 RepID=A0A4C1YV83_EUMVA|nr:hypothetical protein EVAR_100102_1 [Eumeta japonica]